MKHQKKESARALTAEEVADRLHMHPATVRKHLLSGTIPGVRIGPHWRVAPATIDRLLAGELQIPSAK